MKIHSIILSVTCHGLRKYPPLIHIPSKPFMNYQNPTSGVIQRWSGVGNAVKQPKNDSPQNQDLTTPKSFLEGVQNPSFEYKNNFYYYSIIIIVLYSQLYQKIITRCSLYKNLNCMIITLVPREKSRKVSCVLNGTEMLSPKATTKKNMLSHTLSRKQLTIICQKKTQNT